MQFCSKYWLIQESIVKPFYQPDWGPTLDVVNIIHLLKKRVSQLHLIMGDHEFKNFSGRDLNLLLYT